MSITVTNEMLKAVHEYNMGEMGEGSEMTDSRLIERVIEIHEASKSLEAYEASNFDTATLKLEIDNLKNQVKFRFDENVELVFQNETLKNDLFILKSEYKQLVDEKNKLVEKYIALQKSNAEGANQ